MVAPQDIYSLFHLDRPFKFISKTSNFFIPIIGWSMFLTGADEHVCRTRALIGRHQATVPLVGRIGTC